MVLSSIKDEAKITETVLRLAKALLCWKLTKILKRHRTWKGDM